VFYEHEPWGYEVEERRHTQSIVTAVNCVPRAKGVKALNWLDFHLGPWTEEAGDTRRFTPEQIEFMKKRKSRKRGSK